jgi:hypothetical protein
MGIYATSKGNIGNVYPENAIDGELSRVEPIITPEQLKNRHLFGIPLVSRMPDPITKRHQVMTAEILADIIVGAVEQAEKECKIDISPVQRRIKMPFNRMDYDQFGFLTIPNRPIASIEKISITPANGVDVFIMPLEWLETAYFNRGQINIIPMTAAIQGATSTSGAIPASVFFLSIIGPRTWIPAWWQIEFTCGFKDGMVPRLVNEMIGTIAAMEVLSQMAATYASSQSHSLGIDGMSQSVSTPGPNLFKPRMDDLQLKHDRIRGRIRSLYQTGIFASNI